MLVELAASVGEALGPVLLAILVGCKLSKMRNGIVFLAWSATGDFTFSVGTAFAVVAFGFAVIVVSLASAGVAALLVVALLLEVVAALGLTVAAVTLGLVVVVFSFGFAFAVALAVVALGLAAAGLVFPVVADDNISGLTEDIAFAAAVLVVGFCSRAVVFVVAAFTFKQASFPVAIIFSFAFSGLSVQA